MSDSATFTHKDTELQFPVVNANNGNDGYDISQLLSTTGNVTLDPGFVNTASCESTITFIDGNEGILRYRGYPIEQLADQATFLEVAHLLIHGYLPNRETLHDFEENVSDRMMLDGAPVAF